MLPPIAAGCRPHPQYQTAAPRLPPLTCHYKTSHLRALKPPSHIELENMVIFNWVKDREIRVVASRVEIAINAVGIAIVESSDYGISEAVGQGGVNTLQVRAAFEEVGIEQVDIGGILFDVLPIGASLPGVLFCGLPINQTQ